MKQFFASRLVLVSALFAALLSFGLMTSEASAQRRPDFGRQGAGFQGGRGGFDRGGYERGGYERGGYERGGRADMRRGPEQWGRGERGGRVVEPRWERPRFERGGRGGW